MRKLGKPDTGAGLGEDDDADGNGVEAEDGDDGDGDGDVHGFGFGDVLGEDGDGDADGDGEGDGDDHHDQVVPQQQRALRKYSPLQTTRTFGTIQRNMNASRIIPPLQVTQYGVEGASRDSYNNELHWKSLINMNSKLVGMVIAIFKDDASCFLPDTSR